MNIIKTDLVATKYDILWEDITGIVNGSTKKPLLILVSSCQPESAEDVQLKKMLDASLLAPAQYNIIRLADEQMLPWHRLREALDPKIIFLIGVLPSQLGISALFQINAPNNFSDRIWLPTLSIQELEKNIAVKTQLWNNGMKPLFKDDVNNFFKGIK